MENTFGDEISIESVRAKAKLVKKSIAIYEESKRQTPPNDEQIGFAQECLIDLADYERTIVELYFWKNYSISDIAYAANQPTTLIERLLDEAIHKLRLSYLIEFTAPRNKENEIICPVVKSFMEATCS